MLNATQISGLTLNFHFDNY